MAKFAFILAALALTASAKSTKKQVVLRQTCVDKNNQVQAEGAAWYEGVNGCLALKCTNGVAVGTDSCSCVYPDATTGKSGDVWYSVPKCQTCRCTSGQIACDALLNCVQPGSVSSSAVVATSVASATVSASVSIVGSTCAGPDSLVLKVGDKYIEGCQSCECTVAGLACSGMVSCPGVSSSAAPNAGSCFMGHLGFVNSQVADSYVPNGYVFVENCNTCTCTQGTINCVYGCNVASTAATSVIADVTVTVSEEPEVTEEEEVIDDEEAALDCDVTVGIVLNGSPYTSECGADCICVDGVMECADCPDTNTSNGTCVDTDGNTVANGGSYQAEECTSCTCVNGVFACQQTCNRECKTSSGVVVAHGKTTSSTCLKCKCNDATLTCENTCANQVCTVPNSKTTIKPNDSKTINKCLWCKCSSTALLSCRDKCPTDTSCVCNGRMLKSGKSLATSKCESCTCKNGDLTCKDTC